MISRPAVGPVKITPEEALARLDTILLESNQLQRPVEHAMSVIYDLLYSLGHEDIVARYNKIRKAEDDHFAKNAEALFRKIG